MNIRPVEAELFHADGRTNRQTDKTKLTVAFRNFAHVPKKRSQAPTLRSALKLVIPVLAQSKTVPGTAPFMSSEQKSLEISMLHRKLRRIHGHLSRDFPTVI
jgi:hypothetical protein